MAPRNFKPQSELSPLLPSKRQDAGDGYAGASFASAVFSLSTSIVGAGIMGLPATAATTGLLPSLLLILFVGLLTHASVRMLLKYSHAGKAVSYAAVMSDAFGRPGRYLLQLCIIINNFGLLVVYLIIIGDVLSGSSTSGMHHTGVLEKWTGHIAWWNSRMFVMFFTTIFILAPLACFKHVDSLKLSSALSVGLAVIFVFVVAGIAVAKLYFGKIEMPASFPTFQNAASILNLFSAVPVLVTAYICHHAVHPVLSELENPSNGQAAVKTSLLLCASIYVTTTLFGYILFGDETMSDILANFDADLEIPYGSILADIVRVGYAIHLMLVFPILHFSLRLNLDGLIFPHSRPLSTDTRRFAILTATLVTLSFLGASFIPDIWDAFQFLGATSASCLGFIFPGVIVLRDIHGIATKHEKLAAGTMVLLATISSIIAITGDIYSVIQ